MSLLYRHIIVLLVVLFAAASRGDPAGGAYDRPTCQLEPFTLGQVGVKYPFHLYDGTEEPHSHCGYPGLDIVCDDDKPTLRLGGDDYTVSDINYSSLTVSLADADVGGDGTCPMVHHNVTVPKQFHLPTSTIAYLFFFVNCTFEPDAAPKPLRKPPSIKPVTCRTTEEEPSMSFVLPEREIPPKDWWQVCRSVYAAPVLKDALPADAKDPGWRDDGYAKALRGTFRRCGCSRTFRWIARTGEFSGCFCGGNGVVGNDGCSEF